jgi:hypothetical protein
MCSTFKKGCHRLPHFKLAVPIPDLNPVYPQSTEQFRFSSSFPHSHRHICIDGQVSLVYFICLVYLVDLVYLHDEQMVNRLVKIAWASVFHFLFETAAYTYILIYRYM